MKYGVTSLVADNSTDKRVHGHRLPTACTFVTVKTWVVVGVEGGTGSKEGLRLNGSFKSERCKFKGHDNNQ